MMVITRDSTELNMSIIYEMMIYFRMYRSVSA